MFGALETPSLTYPALDYAPSQAAGALVAFPTPHRHLVEGFLGLFLAGAQCLWPEFDTKSGLLGKGLVRPQHGVTIPSSVFWSVGGAGSFHEQWMLWYLFYWDTSVRLGVVPLNSKVSLPQVPDTWTVITELSISLLYTWDDLSETTRKRKVQTTTQQQSARLTPASLHAALKVLARHQPRCSSDARPEHTKSTRAGRPLTAQVSAGLWGPVAAREARVNGQATVADAGWSAGRQLGGEQRWERRAGWEAGSSKQNVQ
ncbi:hypothetical protein C8J57DRAFT_1483892 [Mycena rebaudengoi]|nr:hypothetical protein C8J57DRAFT_1483892 [Mycena rebaudengoi]